MAFFAPMCANQFINNKLIRGKVEEGGWGWDGAENAFAEPCLHTKKRSFCQDRLGTNIEGKHSKRDAVCLFSQVVEILDCEVLYGGDLTCGDRVVSGVKVCTLI